MQIGHSVCLSCNAGALPASHNNCNNPTALTAKIGSRKRKRKHFHLQLPRAWHMNPSTWAWVSSCALRLIISLHNALPPALLLIMLGYMGCRCDRLQWLHIQSSCPSPPIICYLPCLPLPFSLLLQLIFTLSTSGSFSFMLPRRKRKGARGTQCASLFTRQPLCYVPIMLCLDKLDTHVICHMM